LVFLSPFTPDAGHHGVLALSRKPGENYGKTIFRLKQTLLFLELKEMFIWL